MKTSSTKISNDVADILAINERSVTAKDGIRIMELGSLSDLIPPHRAEAIRVEWLKNSLPVRQLTNQMTMEPWTEVQGFVKTCMQVRQISERELPINLEVLLFDDVVAFYRVEPDIAVTIIEDAAFAAQQKLLFELIWARAHDLQLAEDGSTL